MRVIAGTARGRRLIAPPGRDTTRPITDRAKEGIFNMLGGVTDLVDATVLDLFAGSGSFGIEALSRGAGRAVFVERSRPALTVLQRNLDDLGFADRAEVRPGSVEQALPALPHADVAFCDPPYALDAWAELFASVRADVLVGHASAEIEVGPGWDVSKRRTYGRAHIVIATVSDG